MANKFRAPQSCRRCHKTRHTLLYIDSSKPQEEPASETVNNVTHVPQLKWNKQVLLMNCRVKIFGPDGNFTQASFFGPRSFLLIHYRRACAAVEASL